MESSELKKHWLDTYGERGLEPAERLTFYNPEYQEIMTDLYNLIKFSELEYEGFGRKIFCRELAERIVNLLEEKYNGKEYLVSKNTGQS